MKFKEAMKIVNDFSITLTDPMAVTNRFNKTAKNVKKDENIEYIQGDNEKFEEPIEEKKVESKPLYTSQKPQGVMDSIVEELTSVRLQQAIILSEIVGKPKSKTRKRRRF